MPFFTLLGFKMNKPPLKTYLKLCTEFYDLELAHDKNSAPTISFYMDYAKKANGPILEPMCGTGRFLIPMLQAGLDIEGFDASPHMLSALKQKYSLISKKAPPVNKLFLEEFASQKKYNLIFVPFGSWGLITNIEDSKKCLQIMFQHLAPNGKFIIEIETIASVPEQCEIWKYGSNIRADGSLLTLKTFTTYDTKTQIITYLCTYQSIVKNSIESIETENFQQYLYKFDEMDQLLKNAGFTYIKKYADYSKSPVTTDAHTIIYECARNIDDQHNNN